MNIFGYKITIEKTNGKLPLFVLTRRVLAKQVDEIAKRERYYHAVDPRIPRIKAARELTNCGLVEAKVWVEAAFLDYGRGNIR